MMDNEDRARQIRDYLESKQRIDRIELEIRNAIPKDRRTIEIVVALQQALGKYLTELWLKGLGNDDTEK